MDRPKLFETFDDNEIHKNWQDNVNIGIPYADRPQRNSGHNGQISSDVS